MTQKYPDGRRVISPGTLIVSSVAGCSNIRKTVKPVLAKRADTSLVYIPFNRITPETFALGGSALAQITGQLGNEVPDVLSAEYLVKCFGVVQELIDKGLLLADTIYLPEDS